MLKRLSVLIASTLLLAACGSDNKPGSGAGPGGDPVAASEFKQQLIGLWTTSCESTDYASYATLITFGDNVISSETLRFTSKDCSGPARKEAPETLTYTITGESKDQSKITVRSTRRAEGNIVAATFDVALRNGTQLTMKIVDAIIMQKGQETRLKPTDLGNAEPTRLSKLK